MSSKSASDGAFKWEGWRSSTQVKRFPHLNINKTNAALEHFTLKNRCACDGIRYKWH